MTYVVVPNYEIEVMNEEKYIGEEQIGVASGYMPDTVVQGYMNSYPTIDLGTQVADENGEVTFTWVTPDHTEPSEHTFSAHTEGSPDQAVQFTVLALDDDDDDADRDPGVSITPDPVVPGEEIVIEGDDFEPGTEVDVIIEDEDGNVIIEESGVEVDEDGNFEITVPIPEGTEPGDYTVIVTDPETGETIVEQGFTVGTGTGPAGDDGTGEDDGTGDGTGDGLAVTGTGTMGLAALALFLLLAGVGAYVAAVGRRVERQ